MVKPKFCISSLLCKVLVAFAFGLSATDAVRLNRVLHHCHDQTQTLGVGSSHPFLCWSSSEGRHRFKASSTATRTLALRISAATLLAGYFFLCFVKTRERRGSSFSQLGLEPNHTGLTAQSLFFLEESCRVKRSDTQTFSNYFKRVLKLQKRSSSFSK